MKYPMLSNRITTEYNEADDTYIINDYLLDERYTLDWFLAEFALQLDGKTHPYDVDRTIPTDTVDEMLDKLRSYDLLRERRFEYLGLGRILFSLIIFRKHKSNVRPARIICFFLNWLLLISFLPMLAFGAYSFHDRFVTGDFLITGLIVGTMIGLVLHECCHAISCCGYGGTVHEAGVMVSYFIIPGAYVMINTSDIKNRLRRAQVNAAGVEMNLLIAGLSLYLASVYYDIGGFMLGCAIANGFTAFINLSCTFGLDGEHILGNLIGDDNFLSNSFTTVTGKYYRRILSRKGISGRALILASYIMVSTQFSLIILLITSLVGLIIWIKFGIENFI